MYYLSNKKGMNKNTLGWALILMFAIGLIFSFDKHHPHAYDPIKFYNRNGLSAPVSKIYLDTFNVSSSSGYSVDISGAGFTSIKGAQAVAMKNSATATSVPNISVKTVSTSSVVLNITEGNGSLINLLGSNVLLGPSTSFASTSGLQVAVMVFGN